MKSNRTKATDIKPKIRKQVMERDYHRCVACNSRYNLTIAHVFINRSHGGLGIPENLCVLCMNCHMKLDHGLKYQSDMVKNEIQDRMKKLYPSLDISKLKYQKGITYEIQNNRI